MSTQSFSSTAFTRSSRYSRRFVRQLLFFLNPCCLFVIISFSSRCVTNFSIIIPYSTLTTTLVRDGSIVFGIGFATFFKDRRNDSRPRDMVKTAPDHNGPMFATTALCLPPRPHGYQDSPPTAHSLTHMNHNAMGIYSNILMFLFFPYTCIFEITDLNE